MDEFAPSEEFTDFFYQALDHGFGSIEGGGGPLVPFTMVVESSGQRQLTRFALERLEDGFEQAKASVTPSSPLSMYAIVWDGFITLEGQKWDAILVEAGERRIQYGVLLCQRYVHVEKSPSLDGPCERIGNPALVGKPQSRLWLVSALKKRK